MSNDPIDITPYGKLKNMGHQVLHLSTGHQFPTTDGRKFKESWLKNYLWLEYSISKNAAFCYACRQFSPTHERDNVFKFIGFTSWKTALDTNKGFKRHESSVIHLNSMAKWTEAIDRQKTNASVIEMASGNILEYRRNYMKKIFEV